jgi:hypothetical protein
MVYPPLGLYAPVIDRNNNREDIPFLFTFQRTIEIKSVQSMLLYHPKCPTLNILFIAEYYNGGDDGEVLHEMLSVDVSMSYEN